MTPSTAEHELMEAFRALAEALGLQPGTPRRVVLAGALAAIGWVGSLPDVLRRADLKTPDDIPKRIGALTRERAELYKALQAGPGGLQDVRDDMLSLRKLLGLPDETPLRAVVNTVRRLHADHAEVLEVLSQAGVPVDLGPRLGVLAWLHRMRSP